MLENASGGCSATQQDNSVLIECADGTSGVIAGAGTVLVLPDPVIGEPIDTSTLPTGEIIIHDGQDRAMGKFVRVLSSGYLEG